MKINMDIQYICTQNLRGVPYYIINLLESLVRRNNNEYSGSFFDYNRERNNRVYVEKYINKNIFSDLKLYECNTLSFRKISEGNFLDDSSSYDHIPYKDYFGMEADIYHVPHAHNVPRNIIPSKTVVTVHDIMPLISEFSNGWSETSRLEFKNSINYLKNQEDITIITDSKSSKDDMINYLNFSPERIHIVPLGYNREIHYPEKNKNVLEGLGIDSPFLLFLAATDVRKGTIDILDAFEIIKNEFPDLKLVFAGPLGTNAIEFKEKLKTNKYLSDIVFTGFVNDEQKRVLMSSAEAFLFPSKYEGFGLPVIEAMACGAPVITTNASSLPEVGGEAALYVSPKNPVELAESIKKLLNSESLRKELVSKGFENIKKFSWNKTAELTEKVYNMVYQR